MPRGLHTALTRRPVARERELRELLAGLWNRHHIPTAARAWEDDFVRSRMCSEAAAYPGRPWSGFEVACGGFVGALTLFPSPAYPRHCMSGRPPPGLDPEMSL